MSPDETKRPDLPKQSQDAPQPAGAAQPSKADPQQTYLLTARKHARPLTACRFDPQGRFVFTGAEDNTVQRWKLTDEPAKGADGKPIEVPPVLLEGHDSWVRAIAFSPDGQTVYTGGYDGQWLAWETAAEKPTPIRKVAAHNGWVRALATRADGRQIATCGNDYLVKLWNADGGDLMGEFAGHESHVYNLAFHPDGASLVSCDLKANFIHWDLASGEEIRRFRAEALHKYDSGFRADIGGARSLSFSLDGKTLAAGGITNVTNAFAGIGSPAVAEIEWESGKLKLLHSSKEAGNGVVWGLAPHVDGYWIGVSGSRSAGGGLFFWKPDTANEFFKFKLPDTGRDMSLHPDGLRLAVAHADGNVRIYRMEKKLA